MKDTRLADFLIGLFFLAAGIFCFLLSDRLHTLKFGEAFPRLVSLSLALIGTALAVSAAHKGLPRPEKKTWKYIALGAVGTVVMGMIFLQIA